MMKPPHAPSGAADVVRRFLDRAWAFSLALVVCHPLAVLADIPAASPTPSAGDSGLQSNNGAEVAPLLEGEGSPVEVETSTASRLIGSVQVTGNRRTVTTVITGAAGIHAGETFDPGTPAEVKRRVFNLRLFEEVDVVPESREGFVDLTIHVKERWTLFPLPFASASSRGVQGGLFVMDSNFLGRNKLLMLGGTYAPQGGSGFAFYRDRGIAGSRWILQTGGIYSSVVRERFDGNERIFAYEDARWDASLSGGYQFQRWLGIQGGAYATGIRATAFRDYEPPADRGVVLGGTATVDATAQDFHLYFNEGFAGQIRYRHGVRAQDPSEQVVEVVARGQFAHAFIGDQSTSISAEASYSDGDPVLDAVRLGGRPGSRGFEQTGLWAERAVTAYVEHQIPILRPAWGVLTANAFADAGSVEWKSQRTDYISSGAGVRLYLKRMAFPALGIDVAYSFEDRRVLAAASIGLSF